MNKKIFLSISSIFLFLILFSFFSFSFALSPAVKEVKLKSNTQNFYSGSFKIVNLNNETLNLIIFSDYKGFVFSKNIVNLNSSVKEVRVFYNLSFNNISEGENVFTIKVLPLKDNNKFVSTNTLLLTKVKIIKPYSSAFLKSRIDYYDKKVTIPIFNLGIKDVNVSLKLSVKGENNVVIKTFYKEDLLVKKNSFVEENFDLNFLNSGEYFLESKIFYDDKILTLNKNIYLNSPKIRIINFSYKEFYYNSINKFKLLIDNEWNKKLENVYFYITIYDNNVAVKNFKTQLFDLNPGFNIVNTFFDFENLKDKKYDVIFESFYTFKGKKYKLNEQKFVLDYSYKGAFFDNNINPKVVKEENKNSTIIVLVFFVILINIILLSVIFIKLKSFKK